MRRKQLIVPSTLTVAVVVFIALQLMFGSVDEPAEEQEAIVSYDQDSQADPYRQSLIFRLTGEVRELSAWDVQDYLEELNMQQVCIEEVYASSVDSDAVGRLYHELRESYWYHSDFLRYDLWDEVMFNHAVTVLELEDLLRVKSQLVYMQYIADNHLKQDSSRLSRLHDNGLCRHIDVVLSA